MVKINPTGKRLLIFICQEKKQKPDFKKVIPFSEGNKQFFRCFCSNLDESFALKF